MHIEAIDVQRYRKLQHIRLDELRKVNVFVGNNNSGKTSLLEAIQLLSNPSLRHRFSPNCVTT